MAAEQVSDRCSLSRLAGHLNQVLGKATQPQLLKVLWSLSTSSVALQMNKSLLDVADHVGKRLSPDQAECCKATNFLVAICGFVIANGKLTYCGCKVVTLIKVVANVKHGTSDSGAGYRGHRWLQFYYEKHGGLASADLDLTARHFSSELDPCFMGDPTLFPLLAQTEQPTGDEAIEGEGMELWRECGAKEVKVEDYADKLKFLPKYEQLHGSGQAKMLKTLMNKKLHLQQPSK